MSVQGDNSKLGGSRVSLGSFTGTVNNLSKCLALLICTPKTLQRPTSPLMHTNTSAYTSLPVRSTYLPVRSAQQLDDFPPDSLLLSEPASLSCTYPAAWTMLFLKLGHQEGRGQPCSVLREQHTELQPIAASRGQGREGGISLTQGVSSPQARSRAPSPLLGSWRTLFNQARINACPSWFQQCASKHNGWGGLCFTTPGPPPQTAPWPCSKEGGTKQKPQSGQKERLAPARQMKNLS